MDDESEDVAEGEIVALPQVEQALFDSSVAFQEDPAKAAREIVQSILDAEDADEVLSESEVTHARDYLDTPFVALGVNFHTSSYGGEGPGVFATINAATDKGEKLVITCGARNVVAQLYKLLTLNAFPQHVMIVERGTGKDGKAPPMRLVRPDSF